MKNVTWIGISILFFYTLIQILQYYGYGVESYGMYLFFYVFMACTILFIPKELPK